MFGPERVQLEQAVSDVQAMHFGSHALQILGSSDGNFPGRQELRQSLPCRYALLLPVRVQAEQLVAVPLQAIHLSSHWLQTLGLVEEYFPVGQEETQTLLLR